MSDRARAERQSFDELQLLVGLLAEELAGFRVRALGAEQKLRQVTKESPSLVDAGTLQEKLAALEAENTELRERLARATDRARGMLDRVHFLRQQTVAAEAAAGGDHGA